MFRDINSYLFVYLSIPLNEITIKFDTFAKVNTCK
jgi:hypothetical protein